MVEEKLRTCIRRGTLPVGAISRQGLADHLALAAMAQMLGGLGQRHPAGLLDLVIVLAGVPGHVVQEEELDELADAPPVADVEVADLAERPDEAAVDAGLLA